MRKLTTPDLFAAMRIVKESGIREEIKPLVAAASDNSRNVKDLGLEFILAIIECLSGRGAEARVYEFLAGPFEMEVEEVKSLEVSNLFKLISQLAKENDLEGFFKPLLKSIISE